MNKVDVARFVTDLKNSEKLQNELLNKPGVPAFVQVANQHGYHITEEEVREYVKEQKAALTEKELEAVAAGGGAPSWVEYTMLGAAGAGAILALL